MHGLVVVGHICALCMLLLFNGNIAQKKMIKKKQTWRPCLIPTHWIPFPLVDPPHRAEFNAIAMDQRRWTRFDSKGASYVWPSVCYPWFNVRVGGQWARSQHSNERNFHFISQRLDQCRCQCHYTMPVLYYIPPCTLINMDDSAMYAEYCSSCMVFGSYQSFPCHALCLCRGDPNWDGRAIRAPHSHTRRGSFGKQKNKFWKNTKWKSVSVCFFLAWTRCRSHFHTASNISFDADVVFSFCPASVCIILHAALDYII